MGCTGSKPEEGDYLRQIEELNLQLKLLQDRSHEEENLLRFKIEVLVNMLTVEEQRSEIATKRLETLKWVVSTSGDLDSVRHLIHSTSESEIFNSVQPLNAELGEAIEIMRKDFIQFREDIFLALATEDGYLVSSLPKLEFMKQIYGATENVQKNELKLIAFYKWTGSKRKETSCSVALCSRRTVGIICCTERNEKRKNKERL
jgi:hypothetical protein